MKGIKFWYRLLVLIENFQKLNVFNEKRKQLTKYQYMKSPLLVYLPPESFVTVASFQTWRGWQNIVGIRTSKGQNNSSEIYV